MKQLVAYITASYPDVGFTKDVIGSIAPYADFVELGIPFSDPVADGVVIEKANQLSIAHGFHFEHIYDISKATASQTQLLWMGYLNPFLKKGMDNIVDKAEELGVKGLIIPDMPYEEAQTYEKLFDKVSLVNFVAPTDEKERLKTILAKDAIFTYMVAYLGITGSVKSEDLTKLISQVREVSKAPLFLGFGVNESNAKEKSKDVDGVIVGSAIVKYLYDESLNNNQKIERITAVCKQIKESINS